jgi:small multidrug resistance pump
MAWQLLVLGALLEAAGSICLRLSQGFSRTTFVVLGLGCFAASFIPFVAALRRTEVSAAYALWSALDIVTVTVIGILWLQESANASKLLALGLILAGVLILNLQPRAL